MTTQHSEKENPEMSTASNHEMGNGDSGTLNTSSKKGLPARQNSSDSSAASSTYLKTAHPTRGEVDSGRGSVISDGSDDSLTHAKYLANVRAPTIAEISEAPIETSVTAVVRPKQQQAPYPESVASGESQTVPMTPSEAERSAQRVQDHKLEMEANQLLDGAPKLNMSSVATSSSVRSEPVEDDETCSLTGADLLISRSTTDD